MVSILIARGMVLETCARGHQVLRHRGDADCATCRAYAEAHAAALVVAMLWLPDLTEYAMEVSDVQS